MQIEIIAERRPAHRALVVHLFLLAFGFCAVQYAVSAPPPCLPKSGPSAGEAGTTTLPAPEVERAIAQAGSAAYSGAADPLAIAAGALPQPVLAASRVFEPFRRIAAASESSPALYQRPPPLFA